MRTLNKGAVSSIPPCVIFKTPLARKATGNHLMNSMTGHELDMEKVSTEAVV